MLEDEAARARNRERLAHTTDPAERRIYLDEALARVERQIALLDAKADRIAAMIEDARARERRIRAGLAELERPDTPSSKRGTR